MVKLYCHRCRRECHHSEHCYYSHDIDGSILEPLEKVEYEYYNRIFISYDEKDFKSPKCEKCNKMSHYNKECRKVVFINGYNVD